MKLTEHVTNKEERKRKLEKQSYLKSETAESSGAYYEERWFGNCNAHRM